MTSEDKSQMPLFSPEDEKEAQKELKRLRKNENGVFKVNHKRTGFEDKTLWDWLQLLGILAIPLVVAGATILFGIQQANLANQQHENDQKIANQQHEADRQRALDQQEATTLQTYIDNIQDLLLHDNLRGSNADDEVAILARSRTLTALQGLDPDRKGRLVQFIYDSQLIGFFDSKITYDMVQSSTSAVPTSTMPPSSVPSSSMPTSSVPTSTMPTSPLPPSAVPTSAVPRISLNSISIKSTHANMQSCPKG